MAITPGKLQTQSSAHALVIGPDTTPAKYLSRLLIYAVIALVYASAFTNLTYECVADCSARRQRQSHGNGRGAAAAPRRQSASGASFRRIAPLSRGLRSRDAKTLPPIIDGVVLSSALLIWWNFSLMRKYQVELQS